MAFIIGVAHKAQVQTAFRKGFVAFSHGREAAVRNLSVGDKVLFYAPKTDFEGTPVQCFMGHATVTGDAPYEVEYMSGKQAFVRDATFDEVSEVPVKPMLDDLSFIKNPRHWGMAFRQGKFSITEADYRLITKGMGL